jgi:hypothetical protein
MLFRENADDTEYEVTIFDFDEKGMDLALTAHFVLLENSLFIDFGTLDSDKRKFKLLPFPLIETHFFGRIHLEKDSVRFDLLNDEWIIKRIKDGTLSLATVQIADGRAIAATTEELRKFALEQAEDTEAFSEHYSLSRTK